MQGIPNLWEKKDRLWLPVSSYLIEHPKGRVLVDCGWHREMSPDGTYDKKAQIRSLGSGLLYLVNQGVLERGQAVDEQLLELGLKPSDLDYVLLVSDGGYAARSWKEMILPGVCTDKEAQRTSLEWIRAQSVSENCVEILANHDAGVIPHEIRL